MPEPKTIYLKDYRPSAFRIEECDLEFDIYEERTVVRNTMMVLHDSQEPLVLDGEMLQLESVTCNGRVLDPEEYEVDAVSLTIASLPNGPT